MSEITYPMAGKIIEVNVKEGDTVAEGDIVVVLEAMKMEMPIKTTVSGIIKKVNCSTGDAVAGEAVLIVIE
ncbi:MAG: biotin/lipoyl-binding protein [Desulfobacterales bacterium]|nr:biotin/lipoyl-binding protein [Desulfobacteraceae bacterium]MBT7086638.1 biotin/lipoyl-binding protein [Desulfobacterales bacterium]MBT7696850.1 biotin/lipoyl-binding protein [Desulfobacterales bacterium]